MIYTEISTNGKTHAISDTLGRIDLDNLSREIEGCNAESVWWGVAAADADLAADRAKSLMDSVQADLNQRFRTKAAGTRITDDAVKALTATHPEYREAQDAYFQAKRNASVIESVKYAVVQKARNLEKLTALLLAERGALAEGYTERPLPVQSRAAYRHLNPGGSS
jgi:hypothetical protein